MFDWMIDAILEVFRDLSTNTANIASLAGQIPSQFNPTLWNVVNTVNVSAVLPVANTLFGCFIMVDFIKILQRQETKGLEAIHMVVVIVFKLSIGMFIMKNIPYIIDSIFDIVAHITQAMGDVSSTSLSFNLSNIEAALENAGFGTIVSLWAQSFIFDIVFSICNVITNLIIQLRYIEIYVFTAIAAIPLACITASSHEISGIGYNFVKRMSALALQVVFIMVVLFAYSALVSSDALGMNGGNIDVNMWSYLGYSLLLVIALFQTGSWSKALFQVH